MEKVILKPDQKDTDSLPPYDILDKILYSIIEEELSVKEIVRKGFKDNVVNKTEIKIGTRQESNIEVLSGLNIGDIIVAEGLKKVYPRSKIKPIEKGSKNSESDWKKKT